MMDFIKKTLLTGVGLAYLTSEKIDELGKKLMKEAEVSREEGEKFIQDLHRQSDEARKKLKKQVQETVRNTLEDLNIPTREEHDRLKDEVVSLKEQVSSLVQEKESSKSKETKKDKK